MPRPKLIALSNVAALMGDDEVLMATLDPEGGNRLGGDWQARVVVVLREREARELHAAGLLRGWTPF